MNIKQVCIDIARCDTEAGVVDVLKKASLWDDPRAWRHYGDNENNFATIGNQQSMPETAMIEKIINSVDAVMMSACMKAGIVPDSKDAPQSIREAIVKFFKVKDGFLSNLPPKERSILAENIALVATGAKSNPCYAIIDKGEGQTPDNMPETLLSIGRSNKLRIPFVQGKFNMGGTGVLQFCGKRNLQLIISKRNPAIAKGKDGAAGKWGFTIVRREDPYDGVRSSAYKYLAPGGKIISFESDGLPLLPGEYPHPYENMLCWGTFIKLYEYQMNGLKTNIQFDLYNRLSMLMPSIALPVRFYERRKGYAGHSMESTLAGLKVRLEEDRNENLEHGFPTSSMLSAQGEHMKASIYAFKKGQSKKYTKNEGVVFTINGQTHGHLSKAFFTRQAIGMGYLADSLLVIIDCSDFDGRAREDLFMNSRDRLRSGDLRADIERCLEDLLKNHQGLKELRAKRRLDETENKIGDSKPLANVIEQILKKSPTLSKLFIEGVRLSNPFKTRNGSSQETFTGREFPTHFTLLCKSTVEAPKDCPVNVRLRVQYKTDVVNDYFDREKDPGIFTLKANGIEMDADNYSLNLWNGTANLNISIPSGSKIGHVFHFESEVSDVSLPEPYKGDFFIKVAEAIDKKPGVPGPRKPPAADKNGNNDERQAGLDLPNVCEVYEDEWTKYDFNRESALHVKDSGDVGYDFYVNMDNIHLLTEKKNCLTDSAKLLDARYKFALTLLGIALLKEYRIDNPAENDEGPNVFEMISAFTKAVSPVLLPMIKSLGDLNIAEVESSFDETE